MADNIGSIPWYSGISTMSDAVIAAKNRLSSVGLSMIFVERSVP